uniref:Ground-like domain-containing protein n=1 Tax=Syphacia muris TaxID=451379 RepID=A0A0N5ARA9_9BILA
MLLVYLALILLVTLTIPSIAYQYENASEGILHQQFNNKPTETLIHETYRQHPRNVRDSNSNKRQDDTKAASDADGSEDAEMNKCNSPALRNLMLENMDTSTSLSKRRINKKAEELFGGNVDVICSRGHFSYIYSSNLYCETTKEGVTCVAYRQVHK